MSLDVYLWYARPSSKPARHAIFVRRDGATVEISREEWDALNPDVGPVMATINASSERDVVYHANITHNLGKMAAEVGRAGLYDALWRPETLGIHRATQLITPLTIGRRILRAEPDRFRALNPANGWGNYDGLVRFVDAYLAACVQHKDAFVEASR